MAEETVLTGQPHSEPSPGTEGQGAPSTPPTETPVEGEQGEPTAAPESKQEGEVPEGTAPEAYEWKPPEGFEGELDSEAIAQFEPIAKELGLTQEQADKMVALHAQTLQRAQAQAREHWAQQMQTWQNELREDPQFGGAKFDENVGVAVKAIERFGSPGLKAALEETGMGNHPELVRTFAAIGKAISEDKILLGNQSHGARSAAEILYPNDTKK